MERLQLPLDLLGDFERESLPAFLGVQHGVGTSDVSRSDEVDDALGWSLILAQVFLRPTPELAGPALGGPPGFIP